jgi:hypothetical protein
MKRLINRRSTRVRGPSLANVGDSHAQLFAATSRRLCLALGVCLVGVSAAPAIAGGKTIAVRAAFVHKKPAAKRKKAPVKIRVPAKHNRARIKARARARHKRAAIKKKGKLRSPISRTGPTVPVAPTWPVAHGPVTLLLTLQGTALGGEWQQWMNEDQLPSYPGSMTVDVSQADSDTYCSWTTDGIAVLGCTGSIGFTPGASPASPETIINPIYGDAASAQTLLYEQGHVIDFAYLTDPERGAFMHLFGVGGLATLTVQQQWWQGEAQLATTNPPGEQFSEFYKRGAGFSGEDSGTGNAAQQAEFDAMVRADIP